jgi:hypothetical protein
VQGSRPQPVTGHQVEAEVADEGPATAVHDQVVDVSRGMTGEVRVHDEDPVRLPAQNLPVAHGDDQQPPIGQPAQTGGLPGHVGLRPEVLAVLPHGPDPISVEVDEPESSLAPTWRLQEVEALRHRGHSRPPRCAQLIVVSAAR